MELINCSPHDTIEMMREDSWLRDGSYPHIQMISDNQGNSSEGIDRVIYLLEKDKPDFSDSAAFHSFLGQQYLRRGLEFNQELFSYIQEKVKDVKDSSKLVQELLSSQFKYEKNNISTFLGTYENFSKSLELSQNNPTVFQRMIQPPAVAYLEYLKNEGNKDVVSPMFPVYEIFSNAYEAAVKRFETKL